MSEFNPYYASADDEIDDEVPVGDYKLASPWVRLGALLLDGLIIAIPSWIVILVLILGVFGIKPKNGQIASVEDQLIIAVTVGLSIILIYSIFNGYLLSKNGQSIGKMICKIKIVKDDGTLPSLVDSLFKRYLLNTIIQMIPYIGGLYSLIDALMIFRGSHKCLHDDIAGTIVVRERKPRRKRIDSEDDDIEDEDEDEDEEDVDPRMAMILPVGRSAWAIASGYLALISILIIPAPLALLTGVLGFYEIRKNPKKRGMGRAIFGMVIGGLGTAVFLFLAVGTFLNEMGFLRR